MDDHAEVNSAKMREQGNSVHMPASSQGLMVVQGEHGHGNLGMRPQERVGC